MTHLGSDDEETYRRRIFFRRVHLPQITFLVCWHIWGLGFEIWRQKRAETGASIQIGPALLIVYTDDRWV